MYEVLDVIKLNPNEYLGNLIALKATHGLHNYLEQPKKETNNYNFILLNILT